jgi:glycosyltransferase involved in cell wall biosynthesis
MDILFVTRPIVPPWNEGSKNLTWQLASRLTRHAPHLLTTAAGERPETPHIQWHGIYSQKKLTLGQKLRLVGYLALKPPPVDLFHFYFVPTLLTSRILSAVCRFHNKKSVQTIPSLPAMSLTAAEMQELIFADQVIVYSNYTGSRLADSGISHITKIDVGIDTNYFVQAALDTQLRQRLGLRNEDVLILFAGEYARLGGVEVLKRTMRQIVARCDRCHFLIACRILSPADLVVEVELKQTVQKQQIEHRVHFVGEVPNFPALLKASDIFLFPVTDMHGKIDTPLTILEAMAAGLPVVSHNIDPLSEMFEGINSLSSIEDDETMITTLLDLVTNKQQRHAIGAALQNIVQERYDLKYMVTAYERLYDSLCC